MIKLLCYRAKTRSEFILVYRRRVVFDTSRFCCGRWVYHEKQHLSAQELLHNFLQRLVSRNCFDSS